MNNRIRWGVLASRLRALLMRQGAPTRQAPTHDRLGTPQALPSPCGGYPIAEPAEMQN